MEAKKGGGGRRRSTIEDLNDALMEEILRPLPLRSIIRCLVVCKWWRSLIACSPLLHNNTINVGTSYERNNEEYMCAESSQRGGMQQVVSELYFTIDFPNKPRYHNRIFASCNGLLFSCYSIGRSNLFPQSFISNPWTKECHRIKNPTLSCNDFLCGLAFENNSSDNNNNNNKGAVYKIVMAHRVTWRPNKFKFQMYSSDKKSWEWVSKASESETDLDCSFNENAVYCNRFLYWQCESKTAKKALMFNFETETFGCLGLPSDNDGNYDDNRYGHQLTECDGQLHYIQISTAHRLIIWKMSTGGKWLLLHSVCIKGAVESNLGNFLSDGALINFSLAIPIGMSGKGDDEILINHNCQRIISYDLKKGVVELVLEKELYYWNFFRYTPTTKFISER